ncbi:hypothetical protein KP509_10G003000 [Ceratopteris richardii]|uniref:Uncharacterized protein n=1 Tax=Ceratopteris richardii TaxID=49495 RepID=A0A8T2TXU7_CERRI|nr:hypothetical protein KP509_10G003000 [Ceratopteris richardii]
MRQTDSVRLSLSSSLLRGSVPSIRRAKYLFMALSSVLGWILAVLIFPGFSLSRVPKRGFSALHGTLRDNWGSESNRVAEGYAGAVSADDGRCSVIGRDVMEKMGGNAVDAAVAVALCSGVVNPVASGIGGGAFLLFLPANSSVPIAMDFREVAPGSASENMYAGNENAKSTGALSVAVPGELAGLHLLWREYGSLPWKTLFQPAIQLASSGFMVSPYLANAIQKWSSDILADEGLSALFAPNGTLLAAGDTCVWDSLAKSLASIAAEGPSVFYNGSVGENFVNDVRNAGGILSLDDLAQYTVKIRDPIVHEYQGLTVYGMPPPSSGGACFSMVLNILEAYPEPFQAVKGPLGLHRMVEAFKHAYAMRMNLGDPDYVNTSEVLGLMLNATNAAEIQKLIDDDRTYPPPYYGGSWAPVDDHGTSHFNIVDENRNVVTMTSTVNYPFGAKIISKSTGILMNNEMGDFSVPSNNSGSDPPSPANFIEPYKRPLSSMSPIIVMKEGQFLGALGGSGGSRIITTTLQVFLDIFWKGYQPEYSVSKPRLHHQVYFSL